MRLFKHKKGMELFFTIMVVVLLIVLISLSIAIKHKSEKNTYTLGKIQSAILNTYDTAGKEQAYFEFASKQTQQDLYYKSLKTGGNPDYECGNYFGYALINNEDKNCFFKEGFKENFDYEFSFFKNLKLSFDIDYEFTFFENSIKGVNKNIISLPIFISQKEEESLSDKYVEEMQKQKLEEMLKSQIKIEFFKELDSVKLEANNPLLITINRLKDIKFENTNALDYLLEKSEEEKIDPYFIISLVHRESQGVVDARSPTGAIGLFQFTSLTAKDDSISAFFKKITPCCTIAQAGMNICAQPEITKCEPTNDDRFDPKISIDAGITYISKLIKKNDRNLDMVLFAYNRGPTSLSTCKKEKILYECSKLTGNGKREVNIYYADISTNYKTTLDKVYTCHIGELVAIKTPCTNNQCMILKDVNEKLDEARQLAKKEGVEITVTSSYRSYEKQQELYDCYQDFKKTGKCSLTCNQESGCAVAAEPSCSAPHITGGAVDITLNTNEMDHSTQPEKVKGYTYREKLEKIMCDAGFIRYGDKDNTQGEFWHYEYGTDRWKRGIEQQVCALV